MWVAAIDLMARAINRSQFASQVRELTLVANRRTACSTREQS
jgi:hypothetical protein